MSAENGAPGCDARVEIVATIFASISANRIAAYSMDAAQRMYSRNSGKTAILSADILLPQLHMTQEQRGSQ